MPVDASARVWTSGFMRVRPVRMSRAYLTTIKPHHDGTEQRRGHRTRPRKFLEFELTQGRDDNDCFNRVMRELHGYQEVLWAVPDWTRRELSTSVMIAAGTDMDVAVVDTRYMVIGETVIIAEGGRFERRTINNIVGSTLTFVETNGADPWPIGTRVYPALPAHLPPDVPYRRIWRDRVALSVRFIIDPGKDFHVAPPAAPVTFNTREVFNKFPIRTEPIEGNFNSGVSVTDYRFGVVARRRRTTFQTETLGLTIIGCDAEKTRDVEDVFTRALGRRGEFYMPSWENDFRILATAGSGTNTLLVAGDDIEGAYAGQIVRQAVAVQFLDNSWEYNIISGYTTGAGQTTLTFRNNWTQDIDPANVRRISFMPICRFASDTLDTEWSVTGNYGIVSPRIQTLPNPDMQKGTGAIVLPLATLSGQARQIGLGSGAITTPLPALQGTATLDSFHTGSGGVTAPTPTLAGTGEVVHTATGAITAPTPTLSGSGTVTP